VAEHSERSNLHFRSLPLLNTTKRGRVQVKFGPDSRHRGPVRNYPARSVLGRYPSYPLDYSKTPPTKQPRRRHTIAALTSPSIDTKPSTPRHRSGAQGKRAPSKICGLRGWVAADWRITVQKPDCSCMGIYCIVNQKESCLPLLHSTQRRPLTSLCTFLLL
jgi:hypothetical protein